MNKAVKQSEDLGTEGYEAEQSDNPLLKNVLSKELSKKIPDHLLQATIASYLDFNKIKFFKINPDIFYNVFTTIDYIEGVRARQEIVYSLDKYPQLISLLREARSYLANNVQPNGENTIHNESNYIPPFYKTIKFLDKWLVKEFKLIRSFFKRFSYRRHDRIRCQN